MTMTPTRTALLASIAAGALFAALPVSLQFGATGASLTLSQALAKDGGGSDGGKGGGSDDHGGSHGGGGHSGGRGGSDDSGGDDHGGSSGHGGGSNDSSGGGHGGSSGRGGGGDDSGSDDQGGSSGHDGGSDDSGGDDHGGSSGRGDDGGSATQDDGGNRNGGGGGGQDDPGLDVQNADGSRVEISNGRFERKDASGRTVEERPATKADVAALTKATSTGSATRIRTVHVGSVRRVESSGNRVEVVYSTGWTEELAAGRYELTDPNDNTVVERTATSKDIARLRSLVGN